MISILETCAPKSDQLNADDLIGGVSKTIKITKVSILGGEQPVALNYEGDNGKPYKPAKSMRRVIVNCWGSDANKYVGRSLTLYRDDKVTFGGVNVGGIRISHMSDISAPMTMALTASKTVRKPYTVQPLQASFDWNAWGKGVAAKIQAAKDKAEIAEIKEINDSNIEASKNEAPKIYARLMELFKEKDGAV
jgi:hypothetical protein